MPILFRNNTSRVSVRSQKLKFFRRIKYGNAVDEIWNKTYLGMYVQKNKIESQNMDLTTSTRITLLLKKFIVTL